MKQPVVSVIVTTKNNHATLGACLRSIAQQTYPTTDLIVVDNGSSDDTVTIAERYTKQVFQKGPERSAQRNFGVSKAVGTFVLIIDSDMELETSVIEACVENGGDAIIIPEESFGQGFWAKCKQLERSFYIGNDAIEAARFFRKSIYEEAGGYNVTMTGGEDWDLTRRVRAITAVSHIEPFIHHNEGRLYFGKTARKMYYYAQHADAYFVENPASASFASEAGPLARYKLFFRNPKKLFRNPIVGVGMLILKTTEYASGGFGYLSAKSSQKRRAEENV